MLLCLPMLALAFSLSAFYHIRVELPDLSLFLTEYPCAAKVWSVVKFFSKFPGCLTVLQLGWCPQQIEPRGKVPDRKAALLSGQTMELQGDLFFFLLWSPQLWNGLHQNLNFKWHCNATTIAPLPWPQRTLARLLEGFLVFFVPFFLYESFCFRFRMHEK